MGFKKEWIEAMMHCWSILNASRLWRRLGLQSDVQKAANVFLGEGVIAHS